MGALVLVDDLLPVPGRNDRVFHPRLALGPLEAVLAMGVLTGVFARQRANVVGNAERNEALKLLRILLEERVETALVLDDCAQLLEVELIVDGAVIAGLKTAQELLSVKARDYIGVTGIDCGVGSFEELNDLFLEVVVASLVQVVRRVAFGLVVAVVLGGVVGVQRMIGRTTEEALVSLL